MFFQVHEITHFYSDKTSFLKFIFCHELRAMRCENFITNYKKTLVLSL